MPALGIPAILITDVTHSGYRTYPLAPFLRGRGNQGSPLRIGEGSGEGLNSFKAR